MTMVVWRYVGGFGGKKKKKKSKKTKTQKNQLQPPNRLAVGRRRGISGKTFRNFRGKKKFSYLLGGDFGVFFFL